jgi:telomerase reverse transcriptase
MKRKHLFNEWILWLIQRFIVPLLSCTFYSTETSVHRNLIVYFRHRVWMIINQPIYNSLKESVFTELAPEDLAKIKGAGNLPKMRLLPKNTGARPIVNLGKKYLENGRSTSTNALLKPVFNALSFEIDQCNDLIGSSVSCKQDIYKALKGYKLRLLENNDGFIPKLYFAKVDIQACFDSINQDQLLELIEQVIKESEYTISKYSTVQIVTGKIRKKFQSTAKSKFMNLINR